MIVLAFSRSSVPKVMYVDRFSNQYYGGQVGGFNLLLDSLLSESLLTESSLFVGSNMNLSDGI